MSKQFPILYKKDKTGKDRFWQVKIKKINNNHYQLFTESGVVDGKTVVSEPRDITEGKQKRSVQEQAELEANSEFTKKKRANYRETKGSTEISVKPYLLKDFNEHSHHIKYPAFISPKMDGV